ncbi:MAG: hypothetical protein FJX48_10065 [Alphaproteobacteria bacterium]|nr:hypothetical protein [Alphaproteobacteria bacterium]
MADKQRLGGRNRGSADMRLMTYCFAGAAYAAAALAAPSAQSANVPLCLAIAQNYNNCVRQHQMGGRGPHGHGFQGDPYRDYEGGGGFGEDYGGYEGPGYGHGYGGHGGGYRRQGYGRARAACAVWFAQMQASGCFN